MSSGNLQTKVGLFVVICLTLLAAMILNFSKGLSIFRPTYTLNLQTVDVGSIKQQAGVLVGGLRVGSVTGLSLGADGKTVLLRLKIDSRYSVRSDARFVIEQAGFLGDQHVAVYPQSTTAPMLVEGATVRGEEPFNLQEAARAATGFIQKIDQTARRLNEAIQRVDRLVLNEGTLSNFNLTLRNFHQLSDRVLTIADRVDNLIVTNAEPVSGSVSNLWRFATSMDRLGKSLNSTLDENRTGFSNTLQSLQSASKTMESMTRDLNNGEGLAGSLLKDAETREAWRQTVLNFSQLSSNLSHYGLLYKPRTIKTPSGPTLGGSRDKTH